MFIAVIGAVVERKDGRRDEESEPKEAERGIITVVAEVVTVTEEES